MADNSPRFTYPYEQAAMRGEEMPNGLSLPDQLMFLALRQLYVQKRSGAIDRDTGSREKAKLGYQRERLCRKLGIQEGLVLYSARFFKAVEGAASAYAKNRTLANADELYRVVYRMLPGNCSNIPSA